MKSSTRYLIVTACILLGLFAVVLSAVRANAQTSKATIYLVGVTQNTASPLHGDLSNFTTTLLKLRLREMKSFKVEDALNAPKCQDSATDTVAQSSQRSLASEADFYTLSSSLEVRTSQKMETEIALTYELSKCVGGESVPIRRSKEPFAETEVLTYINSMADVVALLLEKERTVTQIVAFVSTDGSQNEQTRNIANELTSKIQKNIKEASDFKLPDQANPPELFRINGEISIQNKNLVYRVAIITKDGNAYPKRMVPGPEANNLTPENLAAFYENAVATAIGYMKNVRYIEEPRRSTTMTDQEYTQSMEKARQLMCVEVATTEPCKVQPELAVMVLTEIRDRKRQTNYELLGKAQLLSGNYADAAASFDRARDQDPANALRLLIQSGDAWFKAKQYKNAITRYQAALDFYNLNRAQIPAELLAQEETVQLQKARSLRYDGKEIEGLQTLLSNWRDSTEMKEELGYVMADIAELDLPDAEKIIEAQQGKPPYEFAKPLLVNRQAQKNLWSLAGNFFEDPASNPVLRNSAEIDRRLSSIEAIPEASLSQETIVMKKTLRGWWFRDYKNDYPNAIKLLEEADKENLAQPAKDDTLDLRKFGRSILLETYYLDAQSPAGKTSYEKASTLLTGWVKEDSFYYPALELFNHKLGKDEETKQLLEDAIRDNRQDYRAYLALARLYTFHLFDLQGGLKTLEQIPPDKTNGEYFRIKAYLQLFMGNYAEAQKVFGLSDSYGIPNVLAAFYNAWALFAQQKDSEGYAAAQQWKAEMEKFRRTSKHKELKTTLERSEATLDAAGRALEIETRLSAKQKKLLRAMYAAMTDQSQPLPSIP